jgi:glycosyltransferase involved in cell wall biosynthesis
MACGCVPIVTTIPSFRHMLNEGDCGYLFEPGNDVELLEKMLYLNAEDYSQVRKKVLHKFEKDLSFEAIANKLSELILKMGKD